jgi:hypothetical protein
MLCEVSFMLNVGKKALMLSVIMLSVMAPLEQLIDLIAAVAQLLTVNYKIEGSIPPAAKRRKKVLKILH